MSQLQSIISIFRSISIILHSSISKMAWLATAGGFLLVRNSDVTLKTRAFRSLNLLLKYIHAGVAMLRGTICFSPNFVGCEAASFQTISWGYENYGCRTWYTQRNWLWISQPLKHLRCSGQLEELTCIHFHIRAFWSDQSECAALV